MRAKIRLKSVVVVGFAFLGMPFFAHSADFAAYRVLGGKTAASTFVTQMGAAGDGISDDSKAEQDAIDRAAPFSTVVWPASKSCYLTLTTLVVRKPITLAGAGTLCFKQGPGLRIETNNFSMKGLTLVGPQSSVCMLSQSALLVTGEFHAGSPPSFISKLSINGVNIRSWGGYGIYFSYVRGFRIANNRVENIGYGGIGGLSVQNGLIDSNNVRNIGARDDPDDNSYGIYVTRSTTDAGDLVSQPRSSNVMISKNFVDGVPMWEALDTHSGSNIQFVGNTTTNSNVGIAAVSSKNHAGVYTFGPLNITIRGNHVASGVRDGSRGVGIYLEGTATESGTGSIAKNVVTAFGTAGSSRGSAINITQTHAVSVEGNIIDAPSPNGIFSGGSAVDASITGNTITDPWTDAPTVGFVTCVNFIGEGNSARIFKNRCNQQASQHSYNLNSSASAAVRIPGFSKQEVQLLQNDTNAKNDVVYTSGGLDHILHSVTP